MTKYTIEDIKEAWVQWSCWRRTPTCGRAQAEQEFDEIMKRERGA